MTNIQFNKITRIAATLAMAVLCMSSLNQCKSNKSTKDWSTFNSKFFMIDYPNNWVVDSSGWYDVQAFTCLSPETDEPSETLSVGIVLIIDSTDLQTAVTTFTGKWDFNTSKSKQIEIGNQPAIYIEANKNDILFRNYFLKKETKLYYLFFAGRTNAFKIWGTDATKIANSLRIITPQ